MPATTAPTLEAAHGLLAERFGFDELPARASAEVIEALLAGRGALAVFPTGGGKCSATSCRRCCSTA